MKLQADRKTLLDALNSASVALSMKNANPYGAFVLMTAAGNEVTVIADSIALRAESSVECKVETPGVVLVGYQKLAALLQRESQKISLSREKDRMSIKLDGHTLDANIPTVPVDAYPHERPNENQRAFVILDGQTFSYALKVACGCAGAGVVHAWDDNVLIQDDGKNLTLASSDGKQFALIQLPSSGTAFKCVLPVQFAKAIAPSLATAESLTMSVFDNGAVLTTEKLTLYVQASASNYADQVVPTCLKVAAGCEGNVLVNREQLIRAMQTGVAMLEEGDYGVSFEVQKDGLAITSISRSNADHREVIAAKVSGLFPNHRINHKMVVPQLRSIDSEMVKLHYDTSDKQPAFRITPEGCDDWSLFSVFIRI